MSALLLAVSMLLPLAGETCPAESLAALPVAVHPPGLERGLASGTLLVAGRGLADPNFVHTVVLLLHYAEDGALGIVINRATGATLAEVLPDYPAAAERSEPVFLGGPVGRQRVTLLVRSESPPVGAVRVLDRVYFSSRVDTLGEVLADSRPETKLRAFVGYAGWSPGQLEAEVRRGDWLLVPGDEETLFRRDPRALWRELIHRWSGTWVRSSLPVYSSSRRASRRTRRPSASTLSRKCTGPQHTGQSS